MITLPTDDQSMAATIADIFVGRATITVELPDNGKLDIDDRWEVLRSAIAAWLVDRRWPDARSCLQGLGPLTSSVGWPHLGAYGRIYQSFTPSYPDPPEGACRPAVRRLIFVSREIFAVGCLLGDPELWRVASKIAVHLRAWADETEDVTAIEHWAVKELARLLLGDSRG